MFDYEGLRLIWWMLMGVLFIGFAIADGFDLGVCALIPVIGKTDTQRRIMINAIAPHWDGNQVWLVTAGGALFAAWPLVYATSFSGFYFAMMLTLAALWLRPIGLDYRSKAEKTTWRRNWDIGISISGFIPPVIFGVAFGNLLQGVPFTLNDFLMPSYQGSFFGLLNPFGLMCGMISLAMFILMGTSWLQLKTAGEVYQRARTVTKYASWTITILFVLAGVWIQHMNGYTIVSDIDPLAASNPLTKQVAVIPAGWMTNFNQYPLMWIAPLAGTLMPVLAHISSQRGWNAFGFIFASLTTTGIILTAGFAMFPFVMPSSLSPNQSLTLWDSTSSEFTLQIMTVIAAIFVPIILGYTAWCYYKMAGRIDEKYIEQNSHSLY